MRFARTFVLAFLFFPILLSAQQTATPTVQSSPQALALLQNSLAALTGGKSITDVTLSGTARRIAGSDDESGTATLKAIAGASRLDLSLSGGTRSEIANFTTAPATGSWSGPDGVAHAMAYQNLLIDPGLFPGFTLAPFLNSPTAVVTYIGAETKNGMAVTHLSAYQLPPGTKGDLLRHLSQIEFFLDAATNLPLFFDLNIHADSNGLLDIPVEIRFSDYRTVNGPQIPFHIQKYINNSLELDLQFQSATLNSGLTASQVGAQ